jgi:hypothetical protein
MITPRRGSQASTPSGGVTLLRRVGLGKHRRNTPDEGAYGRPTWPPGSVGTDSYTVIITVPAVSVSLRQVETRQYLLWKEEEEEEEERKKESWGTPLGVSPVSPGGAKVVGRSRLVPLKGANYANVCKMLTDKTRHRMGRAILRLVHRPPA